MTNELYHYGMPRRSGRYPWGSGKRPYQNMEPVKKVKKNGYSEYSIKDKNGKKISSLNTYDFGIDGFDWTLIADVETSTEHRGKGYATKLIDNLTKDVLKEKSNKGLYLFVRTNNTPAIKLYEKSGFDLLSKYNLDDGEYYIMIKGSADKKQFNGMKFS